MNMVTESNRLDYGDKLVEFYNNLDWGCSLTLSVRNTALAWCGTPKSRWTEVVALKFLGLKISKTSVVCSEKHIVKYICRLSRLSISMMSHTTRTFWTSI